MSIKGSLIFIVGLTLAGCMHSGIPASAVDTAYVANNCTYSLEYKRCSRYSNCEAKSSPTICNCVYDSGAKYTGTLTHDGKQWCGVQTNKDGSSYLVTNGEATSQEVGLDGGSTALAILGVVAAAAIIDAAADSSGGGTPYTPSGARESDSDWDWDAFYDSYGNLQWRCRGIDTGQFAPDSKCLYDAKIDDRWPRK